MNSDQKLAESVVNKMFENDKFSQWLGINIIEIKPGSSVLEMTIRDEMLNGFDIAHGGIVFSLADSALAFAANSYGRRSVSIEASISWPKAIRSGDVIKAKSDLKSLTNKTAIFDINIIDKNDETVGLFRGIVYRTSKNWFS